LFFPSSLELDSSLGQIHVRIRFLFIGIMYVTDACAPTILTDCLVRLFSRCGLVPHMFFLDTTGCA
jgi:hypothetical protein